MDQPARHLSAGTRIRTHKTLESTEGMSRLPNLDSRTPDAPGEIRGAIGGAYGGDVYWVQHDGQDQWAPYCFTEFELE